jgi:hypothetical protein
MKSSIKHFLFLEIRARSLVVGVGTTMNSGVVAPALREELFK